MKRGFTLIELLVAVLIIGVLTAMALPMYQKSVDKSRYATLMPLAKNIKDAQEAFYLGGGKYSKDLGSLDVRVPGNPSGNTATLSDGTTVEISNTDGTGYVKMGKENLNNYYVMYQDRSGSYPGEIHCEALSDNDRANELCQNLGGTKIDNALTSGYTAYVLVGTGENAGNTTPTITKTVVSTEACTQNTGRYVAECTKYVYDDGTYVERYRDTYGSVPDYFSRLYDENGNMIAYLEQYKTEDNIRVCSKTYGNGNTNCREYASISTDPSASSYLSSSLEMTSPITGQDWEGYNVIWNLSNPSVSYGDEMHGNGEQYSINADGSWRHASLNGESETDTWSISYTDYNPEPLNIRAPEETFTAITAAWAAAGYSTDLTALRSWMEGEQQRIVAEYCALDPEHSYCQ